ncbi:MAG: alpha-galactosidase [Bacteroidales bacterium]|nr:alpha-galactosidase [Bacteroidales bacterium]
MKTIILILSYLLTTGIALAQPEPSNLPSEVSVDRNQILIRYDGKTIFTGKITSAQPVKQNEVSFEKGEKINQTMMFHGNDIVIEGEISGSEQAFSCEADRSISTNYDLVRHSVGLSHSFLNRAVYDRQSDWVLSVDEQGSRVNIIPVSKGKFKINIQGNEICLRFRPHFYQKHRGLEYYKPWEYQLPKKPVVGWCSWFAFWNRVTEDDIHRTADVLSEKLVPYGLEYLQIDDGYQREPGGWPETWLVPNEKFPNGMENLASYIKEKDMIPGIWTYMSFHNKEAAQANKELFVLDNDGNLAVGKWVEYCMDGSNLKTIDKLIRPIYAGFNKMGWKYFKVDALRHLRYDGYNSYPDFFRSKGVSRTEAFRNVVKAVREEIGPDNYILACWGVRPELIGIADACRIGTDGYGLGGLSQYNSFNNVVWQNDPDHIEAFGDFAYRDCMATSITGSLYMITDKPEDYETGNLDPIIRTIPVLRTQPGQIYDVDPTRSMYLDRVDSEISGSGERIFDASRTSFNDLFLLEINKSYENWMILGRTGERVKHIEFERLGLDRYENYLVFDFWHKKYLGSFNKEFAPGSIDSTYNCQVFCIRKEEQHPQLVATNRHISCGALELKNVSWQENQLIGESELVENDEYVIYILEPEGYRFSEIKCKGAEVLDSTMKDKLREVHLKSPKQNTVQWKISYKQ